MQGPFRSTERRTSKTGRGWCMGFESCYMAGLCPWSIVCTAGTLETAATAREGQCTGGTRLGQCGSSNGGAAPCMWRVINTLGLLSAWGLAFVIARRFDPFTASVPCLGQLRPRWHCLRLFAYCSRRFAIGDVIHVLAAHDCTAAHCRSRSSKALSHSQAHVKPLIVASSFALIEQNPSVLAPSHENSG